MGDVDITYVILAPAETDGSPVILGGPAWVLEDVGEDHMGAFRFGLGAGGTHVCFIEENDVLCSSFRDVAQKAVSAVPSQIVSLYGDASLAPTALAHGKAWVTRYDGIKQLVIPFELTKEILAFLDSFQVKPTNPRRLVDLFCQARRQPHWTVAVSLIDRAAPPVISSYADMMRIDWETDAAFQKPSSDAHWDLGYLDREKYDVHKLMFEYERMRCQ